MQSLLDGHYKSESFTNVSLQKRETVKKIQYLKEHTLWTIEVRVCALLTEGLTAILMDIKLLRKPRNKMYHRFLILITPPMYSCVCLWEKNHNI